MHGRTPILAAGSVLAALLSPAAASAATTFTVDPAAPAGCSGANVCRTITEANAKVADGDTISIRAGAYQEPTIAVTKNDVTLVAADPGKVAVATSTTTANAPTFTLGDGTGAGRGTTLRGLVVGVPVTGGPAVLVEAAGTLVDASSLQRSGATSDQAVYAVDDSGSGITGGTNTVRSSFVVQLANPAEAGAAPGLLGGAKTSLVMEDTTVVAGEKSGAGVVLPGNDREAGSARTAVPNRITRGTILTQKAAANAVEVLSGAASAVPKATVLDSVVLSPGGDGAGLRAASAAGNPALQGSTAGDIAVTSRHVSVAGGGRPFALDAAALPMPAPLSAVPGLPVTPSAPVGRIAVTADRSIAHGRAASTVAAAAGNQTQAGSSARLTVKDSDTTDNSGGTDAAGTTVTGATTRTADDALFRNLAARDLHLKASAPVIDKAGAQVAGESATDFEGQPRITGAASDTGADEFLDSAPVASLKADRAAVNQGETIAFDATGSSDIDGPVARFAFNFGDGSPAEESTTGATSHQFTKAGAFTVVVGVLDSGGGTAVATLPVTVTDVNPPSVAITAPKASSRIRLFDVRVLRKALKPVGGRKRTRTTTTTTLRKVLFTGTASDEAGVRSVELSLRRVSVTRSRAKVGRVVRTVTAKRRSAARRTAASARAAQSATCAFLDLKVKRFAGRSCGKPIFLNVAVKDGKWAFRLKKDVAYRLGLYVLSARATDVNGVVSAPVSTTFRLR